VSQGASRPTIVAMLSGSDDPSRVAEDWLGTLGEVALFQGLSKRHLRRIAKLARLRRFAPGSPIVRSGDPGRAFFVLLDGSAKVLRPGGRTRRLGVGDYFGEMALLDDAPRSADVVAEADALMLTIERKDFARILRMEPALAQALLRTLAARLRAAEKSI
jgi:CRP-like cAMP-binding protein